MLPMLGEIRKRRKALDLTQQGLADESGVSRSLLAKVERGHANPSYGEAKKIFETLERLEAGVSYSLTGITLDKVHVTSITWAYADQPLRTFEKIMSDNAYSQLPVKRGEEIVGSLTERGIARVMMSKKGTAPKDLLVKDAMEESFPFVPVSASIGDVIPLLQAYQGILTIKDGKVVGLVTNADLIKLFRFGLGNRESASAARKYVGTPPKPI